MNSSEGTHQTWVHDQTNEKRLVQMRHEDKIKIQRRRRRKLFWLLGAAAVCALLLEEQVAVLYVLSAVAISGLMMVLAFSNLEARHAEMQTAPSEKSPRHGRRQHARILVGEHSL